MVNALKPPISDLLRYPPSDTSLSLDPILVRLSSEGLKLLTHSRERGQQSRSNKADVESMVNMHVFKNLRHK